MKDIVQGPLKNFLNFPNKLKASDGAEPSNNGAVKKIPYQGSPTSYPPIRSASYEVGLVGAVVTKS